MNILNNDNIAIHTICNNLSIVIKPNDDGDMVYYQYTDENNSKCSDVRYDNDKCYFETDSGVVYYLSEFCKLMWRYRRWKIMTNKKMLSRRMSQIRKKFKVDISSAKKLARALTDTPFVFLDKSKKLGYNFDVQLTTNPNIYYDSDCYNDTCFIINGNFYWTIQDYLDERND